MKKRNTIIAVVLLLAVVALGVGYAASTGPWVINGTATANASQFDVEFDQENAVVVSSAEKVTASVTDDITAEMSVTLSGINDSGSATFTLINQSVEGIGATFDEDMIKVYEEDGQTEWTDASSEYFTVVASTTHTGGVITSEGGTADVTVTVTLKQNAANEVTEKFVVKVEGIVATQE